jgi:23S rRNA (cytosine1962-C5)-methyltransferase
MRPDHELLDAGGGRRLERFGDRVVDRPALGAVEPPLEPGAWARADLRFERYAGWDARTPGSTVPWTIPVAGDDGRSLAVELRPTDAGQLGIFPEHASQLGWLRARVRDRMAAPSAAPPAVLNLFAYTGLATLALAAAGAPVAHVDAARPSVGWARRNAEHSGLADAPVRWLVDDARLFAQREARRGRRYAGIVLDPPSFGRARGGADWELERDLADLIEACRTILEPSGFALLTAHTPGFGADRLAEALESGLGRRGDAIEPGTLELEARSGVRLRLGAFARIMGG